MRLFKSAALAVVCMGLAAAGAAHAQTVEDILARVDANMSFGSIRYSGRMEITVGGETRYKTMDVLAKGTDKAFVEFTNPEDRGTRYLKLDKNLWIYFPKEQDTVKISGHLLKEGMMGSDVSYEDALESSDFKARYTASLKGEDTVNGRRCYLMELTARVPTASYDRQLLWIDAERYVRLKAEMYAKSGKLLKVGNTLEVVQLGERWFPARTELISKLRNNTRTVFSMEKITMGAVLDDKQFSLSALAR
jgi:outer membrane lipoprotein-sorting protein